MKRDFILSCGLKTLPSYLELFARHPEAFETRTISKQDVYTQKDDELDDCMTVSHRWLDPNEPDKSGEQLRRSRTTCAATQTSASGMTCACHRARCAPKAKAEFKHMLMNVNLLISACGC